MSKRDLTRLVVHQWAEKRKAARGDCRKERKSRHDLEPIHRFMVMNRLSIFVLGCWAGLLGCAVGLLEPLLGR